MVYFKVTLCIAVYPLLEITIMVVTCDTQNNENPIASEVISW